MKWLKRGPWLCCRIMKHTSEVIRPCKVEVDRPAEETERNGEECADDDGPVFVVEKILLVFFEVAMDRAGVVGLHYSLRLGTSNVIQLEIYKKYRD